MHYFCLFYTISLFSVKNFVELKSDLQEEKLVFKINFNFSIFSFFQDIALIFTNSGRYSIKLVVNCIKKFEKRWFLCTIHTLFTAKNALFYTISLKNLHYYTIFDVNFEWQPCIVNNEHTVLFEFMEYLKIYWF